VLLTHRASPERARAVADAIAVLDALDVPRGARLHIVDLEASRSGRPIETDIVRRLTRRDLIVQVGGGIRSLDDARRWLDCGAERIVVGTVAADSPALLASLVDAFGVSRVVPAVDVRDGIVRVDGWSRDASASLAEVFARIESRGIAEALVTTALGLFVAIPAVWMYNYFLNKVDRFQVEMSNSSSQLIDYFIKNEARVRAGGTVTAIR
jgi:phosphoribosylformimino-5-aminoimidazole carboxamide ribonucleotide (ProFAR) isomerase